MKPEPSIDIAVRRELLRGSLVKSSRSVPLQLVALTIVVLLGLQTDRPGTAWSIAVLTLLAVFWRLALSRRYAVPPDLDERAMHVARRALELHGLVAGGTWAVASWGVYAHLQGPDATMFVLLACASVTVATLYMPVAGQAFALLFTLQLGSVVVGTWLHPLTPSLPLAILVVLYGMAMVLARRELTDATKRATRHAVEAAVAHQSLLAAKQAAEAANLAKSQFLATMSHEIRTPMNGVLGALELLRHSSLDAQQRRLVRTAASSGETLMRILNDVLDHSKIEAGKLNLTAAPMALHHIVASVVALFRANAESKGLALDLELAPQVPYAVIGDAQRLKQVLLNLVGNAIKFTEHGGVTLRVQADTAGDQSRVLFAVRDSGIGIAPEALPGLFQPFHQVHASTQRRGGTGLGLTISARIVEAMGGHIEVESTPGRGSTFRFALSFERDPAPPPSPAVDSALARLDEWPLRAATVLLVEDNLVNRTIAQQMLQSLGLTVIEADDGEQALHQLDRHAVDLVLMDCHMPVMDGYEATRRVRAQEHAEGAARLPIIAVTANAFEEDAANALAAGMDAHLAKPYTRDQLRELLSNFL